MNYKGAVEVTSAVLVHTPILPLTPRTICIHMHVQLYLQMFVPHVAMCKHKLTCSGKISEQSFLPT